MGWWPFVDAEWYIVPGIWFLKMRCLDAPPFTNTNHHAPSMCTPPIFDTLLHLPYPLSKTSSQNHHWRQQLYGWKTPTTSGSQNIPLVLCLLEHAKIGRSCNCPVGMQAGSTTTMILLILVIYRYRFENPEFKHRCRHTSPSCASPTSSIRAVVLLLRAATKDGVKAIHQNNLHCQWIFGCCFPGCYLIFPRMVRWFILGCGWRLAVDFRDVPRIVNHQLDTGWLSFWSPRHLLNFCMVHRDSSHLCPRFLYIDPGFSTHHQLHILSERHPTFRMLCCKAS